MLVRFAVCAAMACARLAEIAYSRRNLRRAGPTQEGGWTRATYPLIVAVHTCAIGGTLLVGGRVRPRWLALLLAAQPLRLWVLLTLGRNWNVRATVPEDLVPVTDGPYAFIRHPNYLVVAVELLSLPLSFGAARLAATVSAANAVLLWGRIREEEWLLAQKAGYLDHFRDKARFIPGLF